MKNVTVFRHVCANGLGSLADVLEARGLAYRYIDAWDADLSDFDALTPDLLIVMGGSPGVYQMNDYPFLKEEVKILEKRLAKDLPTLGICLGAQLTARALGANVYKGEQGPENGWFPLAVTEAGMETPVRHFDGRYTNMLHWHGDTFDFPDGAVHLASSDKYQNQAFSWKNNVLALQCHPESTPYIFREWLVRAAPAVAEGRLDLERLRREGGQFGPALVKQTKLFFNEWLDQVSGPIR